MALARNLSRMDRSFRIFVGVAMIVAAGILIQHRLAAIVLAVAGLATVAGALFGH